MTLEELREVNERIANADADQLISILIQSAFAAGELKERRLERELWRLLHRIWDMI